METISIIPIVDGSCIVVEKHRITKMMGYISSDCDTNQTQEDFKAELGRKLKVKSLGDLRVTISNAQYETEEETGSKGDLQSHIEFNSIENEAAQNIEVVNDTLPCKVSPNIRTVHRCHHFLLWFESAAIF